MRLMSTSVCLGPAATRPHVLTELASSRASAWQASQEPSVRWTLMSVRAAHVSMVVSARIESMASAAPAHQGSVGPRVSWMWMNVQAHRAVTVPSVWTSLTAMSVAVQRALRALCVSETWTTALRIPVTTGAVSTALLASHAPAPQATRAYAARARWMSAAASPADTGANV